MLPRTYPGSLELRSILVASDFSPASDKALRHALAIARSFDAELTLLHVVPPSSDATIAGPDATGEPLTLSLQMASNIERRLLCSGAIRGLRYRSIVRAGNIWNELLHVIRQEAVSLLVVGTHEKKRVRSAGLGSVAEQVFRQAACPVLMIGPCTPPKPDLDPGKLARPLLFVTDFSEPSFAAFPFAVSIANRRHSQLIVAHFLSPEQPGHGNPLRSEEIVQQVRGDAQTAAIRRLRELTRSSELIAEPAFVAEFADPAEGILRLAAERNAEGIVLGLGRKSSLESRLHLSWSTAYEVICRAHCPVLTVRAWSP